MGLYAQLHFDYWRHPKTLKLISLLGPGADVYPPRLWSWAVEYASDGILPDPQILALACDYRDTPKTLADALVSAGFLEAIEGGRYFIHNWMERTGGDLKFYLDRKQYFKDYHRKKTKSTNSKRTVNAPLDHSLSEPSEPSDLNRKEKKEASASLPLGAAADASAGANGNGKKPDCERCGDSGTYFGRWDQPDHGMVSGMLACDCKKGKAYVRPR